MTPESTALAERPDATQTSSPIKRVLILSTDLGGGHDALAAGLSKELKLKDPTLHIEVDNGLRVASPALNEFARDGYKQTVERKPWIFQTWYWILSATALARIARWVAWRGLRSGVLRRIREADPDVVVSTYPFLTAVLGKLRREGDLEVPAIGMLIDSSPHDVWLAPGVDLHIAMNPADCARAAEVWPVQQYYPPLQVTSARPAVDLRCRQPHDRIATRESFGLPQDQPVLLVSGGSWGLALAEEDLQALLDGTDVFLAIACGRNDDLADQLEAALPAARVSIIRFTTEMPSLLAACDASLLNAGGMTCHECFALGTPVILYEPIAGHGRSAARALAEDGLAVYPRSRDELVALVRDMQGAASPLPAAARKAASLSDQPLLADTVLSVEPQDPGSGVAASTRLGRFIGRNASLLIALLTAAGLAAALRVQGDEVSRVEWNLSALSLLTAVCLLSIGPLVQAVAFWLLLRLLGVSGVRLPDAMAVWSWSALARYAPGGVMLMVVRVREGGRLAATRLQVLAASAYEQGLAVAGAAIISAGAFTIAVGKPPDAITAAGVAGLLVIILARPGLLGGRVLALAQRFGAPIERIPRGRAMALVVLLTGAGWIAVAAGAGIVVAGLTDGAAPELAWTAGVYVFAWLVGFCTPLAPGGIGVREAVITSFLAPRYGFGAAASIAIGLRLTHMAGDLLASAIIELGYRTWWREADTAMSRLAARVRRRAD